jgi:hypothetical protein
MAGMDNHYRIVRESLAGDRPVDEQTCVSVAILAERLERLQQSSRVFAGVKFSPEVKKLRCQVESLVMG